MTWWQAIILGIVEGLTEYLPVSSTGHLILAAGLLGLYESESQRTAMNSFNIIIQAGAILAVLFLYWSRIVQMLKGVLGRDPAGLKLAIHLLVAFMPAAVLGLLLSEPIEAYLFKPWPVIGALFVGAWLMLVVSMNRRMTNMEEKGRELSDITWQIALMIGFAQCIAMWPGTSRSMMTIVAAMLLGLRAKAAAEFSFLLGLITLTAATGYSAMKHGDAMLTHLGLTPILLGLVAATISAMFAVKWFVAFLNRHGLAPFGWYRLVLASILAVLILTGVLTEIG